MTTRRERYPENPKLARAISIARKWIKAFVEQKFKLYHEKLLNTIREKNKLQIEAICIACTNANTIRCFTTGFCYGGRSRCRVHDNRSTETCYRPCPNYICDNIQKSIEVDHRSNEPAWRNTDATRWCTDYFEILKCFLPVDSSYRQAKELLSIDLYAIVFALNNLIKVDGCQEVISALSGKHTFNDVIDKLIVFLGSVSKENDEDDEDVVSKLKQLKSEVRTVSSEDATPSQKQLLDDHDETEKNTEMQSEEYLLCNEVVLPVTEYVQQEDLDATFLSSSLRSEVRTVSREEATPSQKQLPDDHDETEKNTEMQSEDDSGPNIFREEYMLCNEDTLPQTEYVQQEKLDEIENKSTEITKEEYLMLKGNNIGTRKCEICADQTDLSIALPCRHCLCVRCMQKSKTCPFDRQNIELVLTYVAVLKENNIGTGQCEICADKTHLSLALPCRHCFCLMCIQKSKTCPDDLQTIELVITYAADGTIKLTHWAQLENKKYRNWVRAVLAFKYVKEGLEQFCDHLVNQQHIAILEKVKQKHNLSRVSCGHCDVRTLMPDHVRTKTRQCPLGQISCNCQYTSGKISCPNKVCGAIYDEIIQHHASEPPAPYWRNTDAQQWCTEPWAVAKCFINAPGYKANKCAAEFDCHGLLHVLINNKGFKQHIKCLINGTDVFSRVRSSRRYIFHSNSMELEDSEVKGYIDDMIELLEDETEIKQRQESKNAVKHLQELKRDDFIITTTDEAEIYRVVVVAEKMERELEQRIDDATYKLRTRADDFKHDIERKSFVFESELEQTGQNIKKELVIREEELKKIGLEKTSIEIEKQLTRKRVGVEEQLEQKPQESKLEHTQTLNEYSLTDIAKTTQQAEESRQKADMTDAQFNISAAYDEEKDNIMEQSAGSRPKTADMTEAQKNRSAAYDENYDNIMEQSAGARQKTADKWSTFIEKGDEDMANRLTGRGILPSSDELQSIIATLSIKSTDVLKRIIRRIEESMIDSSNNIVDIMACYKSNKPNKIVFVVFPATRGDFEFDNKYQYPFEIHRQSNHEANEIIDLEVYNHLHFDEIEMNAVSQYLRTESPGLMDKHSNLNMTAASHFKSISYGCENVRERKTCIVFYVSAKGFIPVGEDTLPPNIGPFQTDVREGRFVLTVGGRPGSKHKHVKTGCQISSDGSYGTIGGFVEHPKFGLCAMTCAHVLLTVEEFEKLYEKGNIQLISRGQYCPDRADSSWLSKKCYQPENPDEMGILVDAMACPGDKENSGLDIAFVEVDSSRQPMTGEFPDSKRQKRTCSCLHDKDTFIENQLKYKNGTVFGRKEIPSTNTVVKYGATTTFTTGIVQVHGSSVRPELSEEIYLQHRKKKPLRKANRILKYALHDQINIFSGPYFSNKGDSGSLVMSICEGNVPVAFGILVGGGKDCKISFATPLSNILEKIGMTSPFSLVQLNNERRFVHLSDKIDKVDDRIDKVDETLKEILARLPSKGQGNENE